MNSKTHKVITAVYVASYTHFAVPIDWDVEDIDVSDGTLTYKGVEQDVESHDYDEDRGQTTALNEDVVDLEEYFDCE